MLHYDTICPDGGMVDTKDSKSFALTACGFKSRSPHKEKDKNPCKTDILRGFLSFYPIDHRKEIDSFYIHVRLAFLALSLRLIPLPLPIGLGLRA